MDFGRGLATAVRVSRSRSVSARGTVGVRRAGERRARWRLRGRGLCVSDAPIQPAASAAETISPTDRGVR